MEKLPTRDYIRTKNLQRCIAVTNQATPQTIRWIVYVEEDRIYILHNNFNAQGSRPYGWWIPEGYKYSWTLGNKDGYPKEITSIQFTRTYTIDDVTYTENAIGGLDIEEAKKLAKHSEAIAPLVEIWKWLSFEELGWFERNNLTAWIE